MADRGLDAAFVPSESDPSTLVAQVTKLRDTWLDSDKDGEYFDRVATWSETFKKEHEDYDDYQLYHVVIGSTPRGSKIDTEEQTIVAFVEELKLAFAKPSH